MNRERVWAKLRWDGPYTGIARVVHRYWQKHWGRPRRRRRWSSAAADVAPAQMPADFTPARAARLWPGAADRAWLADAAGRWPREHAEAVRRAAAAAAGRFDLLGSGEVSVLDERGRIRWHDDFKANASFPAEALYLDVPIWLPETGTDIKVPWELSRFQHVFAWLWTEPERYRDVFLTQWDDWLDVNPVARGPNWACAMDVALRAISWTAALAAWGDTFDAPCLRRMWASLATHGHFIRDNLEWLPLARTNHYFSDIVGLAVLGAVLAGYPPADDWGRFAARELRREIPAQFAPDGLSRECCTGYHRLMLELATLALCAGRVSGHDPGPAAHERIAAAYHALALLTDEAGRVPLIGDNDSGRVFPLAYREDADMGHLLSLGAALFADTPTVGAPAPEVALLCGPAALCTSSQRAAPPAASCALADSGLFVLGDRRDRMVLSCGPLTYRLVNDHQHLDYLSFALTVGGTPLIVDPGNFCYTPWPEERQRFFLSAMHNGVTVDEQPVCRVFRMSRLANSIIREAGPRCHTWQADAQGAHFIGSHRGYRRLPGGADHVREVRYAASSRCWTVTDRLALRGDHRVQWRIHLHPDVTAECSGGAWRLANGAHTITLRWVGDRPPSGHREPSWYAPAYGRRLPAAVLVFDSRTTGAVEQTFSLTAEGPAT